MKNINMHVMKRLIRVALGLGLMGFAHDTFAETHAMIQSMRSSSETNVFVSQCVEGEYGAFTKFRSGEKDTAAESRIWRGYGFRNTLGLELMKFTQFSVSHTFVNMRSKADSLENIHGSRFTGELKLVFAAPIGNLEAGGGFLGSRYDYQRQLDNADYLASGYFYSLGVNYFMSSRVSIFSQGKMNRENLVRNAGSAEVSNIKTETSSVGMGFSLWI